MIIPVPERAFRKTRYSPHTLHVRAGAIPGTRQQPGPSGVRRADRTRPAPTRSGTASSRGGPPCDYGRQIRVSASDRERHGRNPPAGTTGSSRGRHPERSRSRANGLENP